MTSHIMRRAALLIAVVLSSAAAGAQETVYLQSGEQYECRIEAITGGQVKCALREEERAFPAGDVQRIEFQKARMFDGPATADELKAADPLFARGLEPSTEDLQERYPQAGYVVLFDDALIRLAGDGSYVTERTTAWRILDQRASESSFQAFYFLPGIQNVDVIFGITVGPDGTVGRISDSTMKTEAVYPAFPEYNYQQRLRFTMKNPVPGATLFLRRRTTGKATDLLPLAADHVMWKDEPALERTVRVAGRRRGAQRRSLPRDRRPRVDRKPPLARRGYAQGVPRADDAADRGLCAAARDGLPGSIVGNHRARFHSARGRG